MIFRPTTDHINRGIQLTALQQTGTVSPVDFRVPERNRKKRRRNDSIPQGKKASAITYRHIPNPPKKMKLYGGTGRNIEKSWKNRNGDWRKEYRGSKLFDKSCRNNGGCDYCRDNRTHTLQREHERTEQALHECESDIEPIAVDPWAELEKHNAKIIDESGWDI